jgi:hypothetical protein
MLERGGHAGFVHAAHVGAGERRHHLRIGENARLPMARLPRPRSTTGAKLRSTPLARISLAISQACSSANASAAVGSARYNASKPCSAGSAL